MDMMSRMLAQRARSRTIRELKNLGYKLSWKVIIPPEEAQVIEESRYSQEPFYYSIEELPKTQIIHDGPLTIYNEDLYLEFDSPTIFDILDAIYNQYLIIKPEDDEYRYEGAVYFEGFEEYEPNMYYLRLGS